VTRVANIGQELRTALANLARGRATGRELALLYLALFFGAVAVFASRWPITSVDTDLWYHLNAGRQIVAARAIPDSGFFSFLRPSPAFLDYYWLSQLGLYGAHALGGPVALVWLRAVLALAMLGFALAVLRVSGRGREGLPWAAFVFTLSGLYVLERYSAIRPHAASYLLIAVFLYLLEARRGLLALPALAILWVNLHGIEYPVMLLILGAYLGEWVLARTGLAPAARRATPREMAAVAVAMLGVLVTPHGVALLATPFAEVSFAGQYIEELRPVDPWSLLQLSQNGLLVSQASLRTLLVLLAAVAALGSLRRATLRPAHLLLLAGGAALVLRMQRFGMEFALLALPLLGAFRPPSLALGALPRGVVVALAVVASILPFRYLAEIFATRCEFPVCTRGLPEGAVAFLAQAGATGDVLNHPNQGGYLEWQLYPRQKIFVDLQTPFLFPDGAIFAADQAFQDPVVFASLIGSYAPAFLLVPNPMRGFASIVSNFPDYAPVFVDDASVLYASASRNPELVARHRLRAIDPFTLEVVGPPDDPQSFARAEAELARIHEIHPRGGRTGVFGGALALQRGDIDTALRRADELLQIYADQPEPNRLRADALFAAKRYGDAAEAYRRTLARLGADPNSLAQRPYLEGRLWASLLELGRPDEAYLASRRAIPDIYAPGVDYNDLIALGRVALQSGHEAEGRRLLEFALQKTPLHEAQVRMWIQQQLGLVAK
jgi:hypothetical protein